MGIETEYGVLEPGNPRANAIALSTYVVAAYAEISQNARRPRWDYEDEDPLCDARGFRLDRASAHPSMLTDAPGSADAGTGDGAAPDAVTSRRRPGGREDVGAANLILTNGARLYVDHAHPEYSSPEVASPLDAVRWDRAGEEIMLAAARALAASPHLPDVALYKNNVDGKGASYGTHENYLMDRAVPFGEVIRYLTPFLVTRPLICGAGRVGIGPAGQSGGFQISQRADYVEAEVGLETTLRRPIINTRDEPHAARDRYRRLHVIIGDATLFDVATFLKVGTTSLVLAAIEADDGERARRERVTAALAAWADAVAAAQAAWVPAPRSAAARLLDAAGWARLVGAAAAGIDGAARAVATGLGEAGTTAVAQAREDLAARSAGVVRAEAGPFSAALADLAAVPEAATALRLRVSELKGVV